MAGVFCDIFTLGISGDLGFLQLFLEVGIVFEADEPDFFCWVLVHVFVFVGLVVFSFGVLCFLGLDLFLGGSDVIGLLVCGKLFEKGLAVSVVGVLRRSD